MISTQVVIVGGGPAGCMAAIGAAEQGAQVMLLERNVSLGRKLKITGKGRCNLTNVGDAKHLIRNTPGNGPFLYSIYSRYGSLWLQDYMHTLGVPTKIERGDRVFPKSDRAADVAEALYKKCRQLGVNVVANCVVTTVNSGHAGFKVNTEAGECISTPKLVIATGGKSYAATGSTGCGYKWAEAMGHTIVPIEPSLVPLVIKESWVKEVQGLSLRNVTAQLFYKGHLLRGEFGEMIFTHYGVSGPIILTLSRDVSGYRANQLKLHIDLKPGLDVDQLEQRILRDFEKHHRKTFGKALGDLLPRSLIDVVVGLSGIPKDKTVNQITKDERQQLMQILKSLPLTVVGTRPLDEAIVTKGGVSTKEVDPKTCRSRLVDGLYFAGEVMDIDAYTGGFNLQAAFSTGYVAGISAGSGV